MSKSNKVWEESEKDLLQLLRERLREKHPRKIEYEELMNLYNQHVPEEDHRSKEAIRYQLKELSKRGYNITVHAQSSTGQTHNQSPAYSSTVTSVSSNNNTPGARVNSELRGSESIFSSSVNSLNSEITNDINGFSFSASGLDTGGFDANGFDGIRLNTNGFGTNGFDTNGFETNEFDTNGFDTNGFETNEFDTNGFDTNGFETNGFEFDTNEFGTHKFSNGFDNDFNTTDFDIDFDDIDFNNCNGYIHGFDVNEQDIHGFDARSYNNNGDNQSGDGFMQ